jgi:outer membrane protein OmpA-like peptidoglycan-associated protein
MQARGHRRSSPRTRLRLLLALAPLWLLAACGTPDNLFVLLPNEDGSVGRIEIASTTGSQTLDAAQEATGLDRAGQAPVEPFALTAEEIQTAFGQALAAQPAAPEVFILYFRTGTTELVPESQVQLPDIIATVTARTAPDVSVTGHTDRAGSDEFNMRLSLDRAESVRDALVEAGLTVERIEVTSHGENNPLIPTADDVSEPRNRRVEVTVR